MNYEAGRVRQPGDVLPPAFIRRCREKRGLSYEQVRKLMGLKSRSTPHQWENGTVACGGPVAELFLERIAGQGDPFIFDRLLRKLDDLWGGPPAPRIANRTFGWRLSPDSDIDFSMAWGNPEALLIQMDHGEWPPQRGLRQTANWGSGGVEVAFPLPDFPDKQLAWCMEPDLSFAFRRLGFEDSPHTKLWQGPSAEPLWWFGRRETLHLALATCCFFQRVARACIEDRSDAKVEIFGELRGTKGRTFWEPPPPRAGLHLKRHPEQNGVAYDQDIVEFRISKSVQQVCEAPQEAAIELVAGPGARSNPLLAEPQVLHDYLKKQKSEEDVWFKDLLN